MLDGSSKRENDDKRALLAALIEVDADALDEQELAVEEKLREQTKGRDREEPEEAMR